MFWGNEGEMRGQTWRTCSKPSPDEPDEGPAAGPLLDHYFADPQRHANFPPSPSPDATAIAAKFLASGGSAAGIDGRPYEIYHHGLAFSAFLLGQAFHATHAGDVACSSILGPHIDLGVWIPKKDGAETPAGQRPLQLPSTLRRTFGAVLMDIVGPIVEPRFSRHQAAVRGGSCGPNIILTFHHLASLQINPVFDHGPLWQALLGPAAEACDNLCRQAADPDLDCIPAAVLADQSKAFERLSLPWLVRVLRAWRMPDWIVCAFLALTFARGVRSVVSGRLSTLHILRCGLGMGGPASPFLWNLAYDPIVVGLADTVSHAAPHM